MDNLFIDFDMIFQTDYYYIRETKKKWKKSTTYIKIDDIHQNRRHTTSTTYIKIDDIHQNRRHTSKSTTRPESIEDTS